MACDARLRKLVSNRFSGSTQMTTPRSPAYSASSFSWPTSRSRSFLRSSAVACHVRPTALWRAHHVGRAERLRRVDAMSHVGHRIRAHAGVGVQQVAVRTHGRTDARAETKIFDDTCRLLVVEIVSALDRYFEQIESEPRDMLRDLRKSVGGQWRGPDPGSDSDLYWITLGSGFTVHGSGFKVQSPRFRELCLSREP